MTFKIIQPLIFKLPTNMTKINFDNYTTFTLSKEFLEKFCTPPSEIEITDQETLNITLALLANVAMNNNVFDYSANANTHLSPTDLLYLGKFKCTASADRLSFLLENDVMMDYVSKFCPKPCTVQKHSQSSPNADQSNEILPGYDNFCENIDSMLEGWGFSIKDLPTGVFLAGGSIITALLELSPEPYQDLDLWVYGEPGTHYQTFARAVDFLTGCGNVVCAVNKSVCTFVKPGAPHNIQLIYTGRSTPEDVVDNFDLPYLRNYYIGGSSLPSINPVSKSILEHKSFRLSQDDKIIFTRLVKTLSYGLVITNMPILRPSIPDDCPLLRCTDIVNDKVLNACKSLIGEWKQRPEWLVAENKYVHVGSDVSENRTKFLVSKILPNLFVTTSAKEIIDKFSYDSFTEKLYHQVIHHIGSLYSIRDITFNHIFSGKNYIGANNKDSFFYRVKDSNCYVTEPLRLMYINDGTVEQLKTCKLSSNQRETFDFVFDLSTNPELLQFIDSLNKQIIFDKGINGEFYRDAHHLKVQVNSSYVQGVYNIGESYKVTFAPSKLCVMPSLTTVKHEALSIE